MIGSRLKAVMDGALLSTSGIVKDVSRHGTASFTAKGKATALMQERLKRSTFTRWYRDSLSHSLLIVRGVFELGFDGLSLAALIPSLRI